MNLIKSLTFVILISSCRFSPSKKPITYRELFQDTLHKFYIDSTSDSVITAYDANIDDSYGYGVYSFSPNGELKKYDFICKIDSSQNAEKLYGVSKALISSYAEHYDKRGKIEYSYRYPLVFKTLELSKDSICLVAYFFTMRKKYYKINLSFGNQIFKTLQLTPSARYSFCGYTRTKVLTKGLKNIKLIVDFSYFDSISRKSNSFQDTTDYILP